MRHETKQQKQERYKRHDTTLETRQHRYKRHGTSDMIQHIRFNRDTIMSFDMYSVSYT